MLYAITFPHVRCVLFCFLLHNIPVLHIVQEDTQEVMRVIGSIKHCPFAIMRYLSHHIPVIHKSRDTCCNRLDHGYAKRIMIGSINKRVYLLQDLGYVFSATDKVYLFLQAMLLAESQTIVIAPWFFLVFFPDKKKSNGISS